MTELGTMEELPEEYRKQVSDQNLLPLWPALRAFLPYGKPSRDCETEHWDYNDIRPLLMEAGELTPIEKAERRVLVLANPSLGTETARATPTIYLGMQLIKPGETAPNHKHTPCAIRFVVEGEGGFTTVEGEKLPMEKGDLIITPSGLWHEHGHSGKGPVVWLDALDLPLMYYLDASYAEEGESQTLSNKADRSQTIYRRAGLLPYEALDRQVPADYPMCRYPWKEVKTALLDMAEHADENETLQLAYVNPETGAEVLPALGFSALCLRGGEVLKMNRRSSSQVFHVIEGHGTITVDGDEMDWKEASTTAIPTHADIILRNSSQTGKAFLFVVDDAPLQRKLGFYEEFKD